MYLKLFAWLNASNNNMLLYCSPMCPLHTNYVLKIAVFAFFPPKYFVQKNILMNDHKRDKKKLLLGPTWPKTMKGQMHYGIQCVTLWALVKFAHFGKCWQSNYQHTMNSMRNAYYASSKNSKQYCHF